MNTPFIIDLKEVERIKDYSANVIQYAYRNYKNRIFYKNIVESFLQERLIIFNNECAYRIQNFFKKYIIQNKKLKEEKCNDNDKREEMRVFHRSHNRSDNRHKSDEMSSEKTLTYELSRLNFGITK